MAIQSSGKHHLSNSLRLTAGVAGVVLLLLRASAIQTTSHVLLYAATWITFLHILIGVDILIRCLHAYAPIQQGLDILAGIFLGLFLVSFTFPALWAAILAGLVGVAVLKYGLLHFTLKDRFLRGYVREKLLLEGPAVLLLALAAAILWFGDMPRIVTLGIEMFLLTSTTAFAIWMIFIKKRSRQIRKYQAPP